MQGTTFRLGALVALVGALPAPLDDASDAPARPSTIKKHKKHHSLEPSMHDEAFDVTMERRGVDCAEDEDCCSIDLHAEFEDVLEHSGEEMCWDIQSRPDESNRRGPFLNDNVGHVHACEHFAFLHKGLFKGSWAYCQESGSDLADRGTPCTYISTRRWYGLRRHGYCRESRNKALAWYAARRKAEKQEEAEHEEGGVEERLRKAEKWRDELKKKYEATYGSNGYGYDKYFEAARAAEEGRVFDEDVLDARYKVRGEKYIGEKYLEALAEVKELQVRAAHANRGCEPASHPILQTVGRVKFTGRRPRRRFGKTRSLPNKRPTLCAVPGTRNRRSVIAYDVRLTREQTFFVRRAHAHPSPRCEAASECRR